MCGGRNVPTGDGCPEGRSRSKTRLRGGEAPSGGAEAARFFGSLTSFDLRSATALHCFLEHTGLQKARWLWFTSHLSPCSCFQAPASQMAFVFTQMSCKSNPMMEIYTQRRRKQTSVSLNGLNRWSSPQIHHTYNVSLLPLILICLLDQTQHFLAATKPIKESINVLWPTSSSSRDSLCLFRHG